MFPSLAINEFKYCGGLPEVQTLWDPVLAWKRNQFSYIIFFYGMGKQNCQTYKYQWISKFNDIITGGHSLILHNLDACYALSVSVNCQLSNWSVIGSVLVHCRHRANLWDFLIYCAVIPNCWRLLRNSILLHFILNCSFSFDCSFAVCFDVC